MVLFGNVGGGGRVMAWVRDVCLVRRISWLPIMAVLCSLVHGEVLYVDDEAGGGGTGRSWAEAYVHLQDALAEADNLAKPVEIRVVQGVYHPDRGAGQTRGDRYATFALVDGVTLKGGFAGLGTPDPNARNVASYETTLSGALGGPSSHSLFVVTGSGADRTAILDGFTVRDGAGGMMNDQGSPTLIACTFTGNSAFAMPGAGAGGGMLNREGSPILIDCTFSGNDAFTGGGMRNEGGSPTLIGCVFSGNSAQYVGGGMENRAAHPTLTRCVFSGNIAGRYGGGICNTDSAAVLTHCTLSGNAADLKGGGICNLASSPALTHCILWSNSAAEGRTLFDDASSSTAAVYSDVQDGWPGANNLDADPLFADLDGDDLHLKSQAGRWNPSKADWVTDDVSSPCIDAGDPASALAFEPCPNGGVINLGAYGGTGQASKSPSGVQAKYGYGAGEPNDPYLIYTAEHLNAIGAHPADWTSHFKLAADLDSSRPASIPFTIIGADEDHAFAGVFDGDGHTISHFHYDSVDAASYVGLFGYVSGAHARIKNVLLVEPEVWVPNGNNVGALVGYLNEATVADCSVQGGTVRGQRGVGAVAGFNRRGTITRTGSTAHVDGAERVGGLVGYNDGTVAACYTRGHVFGQANAAGGLTGQNEGLLTDCYARTSVTGGERIGGLVGKNAGTIARCYATGAVTAEKFAGGLLGSNVVGGTVEVLACFWDVQSSGLSNMYGLGGDGDGDSARTTLEMQSAGTFLAAGWDFLGETDNGVEDLWWIDEGRDYPRLCWEGVE